MLALSMKCSLKTSGGVGVGGGGGGWGVPNFTFLVFPKMKKMEPYMEISRGHPPLPIPYLRAADFKTQRGQFRLGSKLSEADRSSRFE